MSFLYAIPILNWIPVNIGTGKHFMYSLNLHITSGWCMENLEELPFKCLNEKRHFGDSINFWFNFAAEKSFEF